MIKKTHPGCSSRLTYSLTIGCYCLPQGSCPLYFIVQGHLTLAVDANVSLHSTSSTQQADLCLCFRRADSNSPPPPPSQKCISVSLLLASAGPPLSSLPPPQSAALSLCTCSPQSASSLPCLRGLASLLSLAWNLSSHCLGMKGRPCSPIPPPPLGLDLWPLSGLPALASDSPCLSQHQIHCCS